MKGETTRFEQRKREMWLALASRHLPLLYRFVRHELAYFENMGDVLPGELTAEEVVDALLLRAQREFLKQPVERNIRGWLIRLAREQLAHDVERVQARRERTVPVEEDTSELPLPPAFTVDGEIRYFYEVDNLTLEDLVPDIEAPSPDEEMEIKETWSCVSGVIAKMPREWQQALLLCDVEGFTGAELAVAIDKPPREAQRLLEQARKALRAGLQEAGCRFKAGGGRTR